MLSHNHRGEAIDPTTGPQPSSGSQFNAALQRVSGQTCPAGTMGSNNAQMGTNATHNPTGTMGASQSSFVPIQSPLLSNQGSPTKDQLKQKILEAENQIAIIKGEANQAMLQQNQRFQQVASQTKQEFWRTAEHFKEEAREQQQVAVAQASAQANALADSERQRADRILHQANDKLASQSQQLQSFQHQALQELQQQSQQHRLQTKAMENHAEAVVSEEMAREKKEQHALQARADFLLTEQSHHHRTGLQQNQSKRKPTKLSCSRTSIIPTCLQ